MISLVSNKSDKNHAHAHVQTREPRDRTAREASATDAGIGAVVDVATRGRAYREGGWTRFDDRTAPYSADDVARERERYVTVDR